MVRGGIFPFFGMSFSCCWKDVRLKLTQALEKLDVANPFQLLLKGCTIEADKEGNVTKVAPCFSCCWKDVRLKLAVFTALTPLRMFQLLLKGCTIEAFLNGAPVRIDLFQLLLKGCTIEASPSAALIQQEKQRFSCCWKDVRLKHYGHGQDRHFEARFQLLLKGCTIEAIQIRKRAAVIVSVVVERMYDWSFQS